MPFNDCYVEYDQLTNSFICERTNKDSVLLDRLIGATLGHDYTKELGRTGSNLTIKVTEQGLFFRLFPVSSFALSIYKKVKRGVLRHCSVSYGVRDKTQDKETERRMSAISKLMDNKVIVEEYRSILVFEISIGNHPANTSTFCTTDPNDLRLKGIKWDE